MRRRILCLGLSMLMVIGVMLTGCDSEGNENVRDENKNATTVTLLTSKGEGTTDEAIELVEKAINVITENKLNTHVELIMCDKDEIEDTVLSRVNEISDKLQKGETLAADEVNTEEEDKVIVDEETGRKSTQYPDVKPTQFDIVLINGIDTYHKYMTTPVYYQGDTVTGLLAEFTPSVLISQYLNASLLTTAQDTTQIQGDSANVYAIPNNRDFGQYTYLIINKELADRYGYDPNELAMHQLDDGDAAGFTTSVEMLYDYLSDVHTGDPNMRLVEGMPAPEGMHYTIGSDLPFGRSHFVLSGVHTTTMLEAPPANIFSSNTVKGYYRLMAQLNQWGQLPTSDQVDFSRDFAAAYLRGNATDLTKVDTDKYYVVVTNPPIKDNAAVYGSMYGVTKYSVNAERAAEVLELFNTNREFRNLMYYGIQNVHYMIDDHGEYVRLNDQWNMDIYDTGNLYLLERSKELGDYYYAMSENSWEAGKTLNRDAIDSLVLGFTYDSTPEVEAALDVLRTKMAEWDDMLIHYSGGDINTVIAGVKDELDFMPQFELITDNSSESNSVLSQYRKWYEVLNPGQGG